MSAASYDATTRHRGRAAADAVAHLGFTPARHAALRAMGHRSPRAAPETARIVAAAFALQAVEAIERAPTAAADEPDQPDQPAML